MDTLFSAIAPRAFISLLWSALFGMVSASGWIRLEWSECRLGHWTRKESCRATSQTFQLRKLVKVWKVMLAGSFGCYNWSQHLFSWFLGAWSTCAAILFLVAWLFSGMLQLLFLFLSGERSEIPVWKKKNFSNFICLPFF